MTTDSFDDIKSDTVDTLGRAVATVARKAIAPELEPFRTRLDEVNRLLSGQLHDLALSSSENARELKGTRALATSLHGRAEDLKDIIEKTDNYLARVENVQGAWLTASADLQAKLDESTQAVSSMVASHVDRLATRQRELLAATAVLSDSLDETIKVQSRKHGEYESYLSALAASQEALRQLLERQENGFGSGVSRFLRAQQEGMEAWETAVTSFQEEQKVRLSAFDKKLVEAGQAQQPILTAIGSLQDRLATDEVDRGDAAMKRGAVVVLLDSVSKRLDQQAHGLEALQGKQRAENSDLMAKFQTAEANLTMQTQRLINVRNELKRLFEAEVSGWSDTQKIVVDGFRAELARHIDRQNTLLETISAFDARFAREADLRSLAMSDQDHMVKDLRQTQIEVSRVNKLTIAILVISTAVAASAGVAIWYVYMLH